MTETVSCCAVLFSLSWQGWGSSTVEKKKDPIKVDASNPEKAVKEALKQAREFEDIAKYLGTSESKKSAGITGLADTLVG